MKVQEYLKTHTYEDLEKELNIKVNLYDDRVVLNYSQIDTPKHHPIAKECRGLILSVPDNQVLCRSFDRFFNYREDPKTDEFDISKAIIFDKIDGSLCNVYWDWNTEKWQVATRGMAFAEGLTPSKKRTYREVFIEALGGDPDDVFNQIDKDLCILCELVSPETRVVTPYSKPGVYVLDVRNRLNGTYLGYEITQYWDVPDHVPAGWGWSYPKKHYFKTFDEVMEGIENLPAMEEGYVAQIDSWKIKIKNPAYLAIAHLRINGEINKRRICYLVAKQDHEEYLGYFPEDQQIFQPYIDAYDRMIEEVNRLWLENKDKEQKEFALAVKDRPASSILFNLKKGKTIDDYMQNATKNYLERLICAYI